MRLRILGWVKKHKFWTVIIMVVALTMVIDMTTALKLSWVAGYICGLAIGVKLILWVGRLGKRSKNKEYDNG